MRDDAAYLLDILLAAGDALSFVKGMKKEEFEKNRMCQLAVVKAIEIIGEAASRVSAEMKALHPEIPWAEMIGMRNRLVHAYFEINVERVWDTTQADLLPLLVALRPLVPDEERSES